MIKRHWGSGDTGTINFNVLSVYEELQSGCHLAPEARGPGGGGHANLCFLRGSFISECFLRGIFHLSTASLQCTINPVHCGGSHEEFLFNCTQINTFPANNEFKVWFVLSLLPLWNQEQYFCVSMRSKCQCRVTTLGWNTCCLTLSLIYYIWRFLLPSISPPLTAWIT